nr:MAG TPA: hypothetical protein [Caudoviricetes sp.]
MCCILYLIALPRLRSRVRVPSIALFNARKSSISHGFIGLNSKSNCCQN